MNRILILAVLFSFFIGNRVQSQSLQVKSGDLLTRINLLSLRKLSFAENALVVNYRNGSTENLPLNVIDKIWFESSPSDVRDVSLGEDEIVFYPNPVDNQIWIKGVESEEKISLFHVDGKLVMEQIYIPGEPMDVSALQAGFYLLKIKGKTFKMRKQ